MSGAIAYVVMLSIFVGLALGLFFGLRAAKLI
ncbi:MAG: cytochrome b6-f complex subunit PetL [Elainellaceae cyanobacterium]